MTYLTRFGRARHVRRTRVLRLTVRAVVGGAPVEGEEVLTTSQCQCQSTFKLLLVAVVIVALCD